MSEKASGRDESKPRPPAKAKPKAKTAKTEETTEEKWKANVKTIAGAVLLALFIRMVFFEAFEIDGPSMEPTLFDGDRVVVAKYPYGLFPLITQPGGVLTNIPVLGGHEAMFTWGAPNAGDVVIVHSPYDDVDIVKRVIGVPGDVIEMRDDVVFRNDEPLQIRIDGPCLTAEGNEDHDCERVLEHIEDHEWHTSRARITIPDTFEPMEVPDGHIFVLGDHRDRSNDSRNPRVGMIPGSRVKGRALAIYWSNEEGVDVRWDRIFESIR